MNQVKCYAGEVINQVYWLLLQILNISMTCKGKNLSGIYLKIAKNSDTRRIAEIILKPL